MSVPLAKPNSWIDLGLWVSGWGESQITSDVHPRRQSETANLDWGAANPGQYFNKQTN